MQIPGLKVNKTTLLYFLGGATAIYIVFLVIPIIISFILGFVEWNGMTWKTVEFLGLSMNVPDVDFILDCSEEYDSHCNCVSMLSDSGWLFSCRCIKQKADRFTIFQNRFFPSDNDVRCVCWFVVEMDL